MLDWSWWEILSIALVIVVLGKALHVWKRRK